MGAAGAAAPVPLTRRSRASDRTKTREHLCARRGNIKPVNHGGMDEAKIRRSLGPWTARAEARSIARICHPRHPAFRISVLLRGEPRWRAARSWADAPLSPGLPPEPWTDRPGTISPDPHEARWRSCYPHRGDIPLVTARLYINTNRFRKTSSRFFLRFLKPGERRPPGFCDTHSAYDFVRTRYCRVPSHMFSSGWLTGSGLVA